LPPEILKKPGFEPGFFVPRTRISCRWGRPNVIDCNDLPTKESSIAPILPHGYAQAFGWQVFLLIINALPGVS
jgi:hypothetical protein